MPSGDPDENDETNTEGKDESIQTAKIKTSFDYVSQRK